MSSRGDTPRPNRELELLLLCAHTTLEADRVARLRSIASDGLDWERLRRLADDHGLISLLHLHLVAHCRDLTPPDFLSRLTIEQTSIARFNLTLSAELLRIAEFFAAASIDVLAYKGPALAVWIYGNVALRRFTDLDILVRPRDLLRAATVLVDAGYTSSIDLATLRLDDLPSEGQLMLSRSEIGCRVELHWEIAQRYFSVEIDPDELWLDPVAVPIGRGSVPTFSAENTLLVLAAHHTKHRWERAIWICDISQALQAKIIDDWSAVLERASRAGVERMLLLGVLLAHELLGAELPGEVDRHLDRHPAARELAREVGERMAMGIGGFSEASGRSAFHLHARERPRDRIRYALRRLFVPTLEDREQMPLPPALRPLHYLLRPLRLVMKRVRRRGSGN